MQKSVGDPHRVSGGDGGHGSSQQQGPDSRFGMLARHNPTIRCAAALNHAPSKFSSPTEIEKPLIVVFVVMLHKVAPAVIPRATHASSVKRACWRRGPARPRGAWLSLGVLLSLVQATDGTPLNTAGAIDNGLVVFQQHAATATAQCPVCFLNLRVSAYLLFHKISD